MPLFNLNLTRLGSIAIPLSTSSGWTVTSQSGTGAGSIITGTQRARTTVTSGTLGWAENTRSITQDLPTLDGSNCELIAQLVTFTNADVNSRAQIVIQYPVTGIVFGITIYGDGTFETGFLSSAGLYTAGTSSAAGTLPLDGTGWVKLRVRGGLYEGLYGVSAGSTPPTQWYTTGSSTAAISVDGDLVPTEFTAGGGQLTTGPVGNLTIEWANLSVKNLS